MVAERQMAVYCLTSARRCELKPHTREMEMTSPGDSKPGGRPPRVGLIGRCSKGRRASGEEKEDEERREGERS